MHLLIQDYPEAIYAAFLLSEKYGTNCVQTEIDYMLGWIKEWEKFGLVVVPSNHNDWLDKWVRLGQGAKDIKNAFIFNKFRNTLFQEEAPKGLVAKVIDDVFSKTVKTLHRNDSFKVKGYELNNHGDLGANGAKGTSTTFKKLNVKIVSGDKHFAYSLDGAHGVGISTVKNHGYNRGLSSWVQSHGVINGNGKFQHLLYSNNKFTKLI